MRFVQGAGSITQYSRKQAGNGIHYSHGTNLSAGQDIVADGNFFIYKFSKCVCMKKQVFIQAVLSFKEEKIIT